MMNSAGSYFKSFITGFTTIGAGTLLSLVFTFLFIYQRERYQAFFLEVFSKSNRNDTVLILNKINKVAQKYLFGRFISVIILTFAYWVGLMLLGLKNAFLLSAIAALLTIIPYVGTVVGGLFPFTLR